MPPARRKKHEPELIAISTGTIIRVAIFFLSLAFLWFIRDIVALLFVSLLLASIINPLADWFRNKGMSRGTAVVFLYLLIIGIVTLLFTALIPAVVVETRDLVDNADHIWASVVGTLGPLQGYVASGGLGDAITQYFATESSGVSTAAGGLVTTIRGFFGGMASLIIVFVATFYLVVSEDSIRKLFKAIAPEPYQPYLLDLFERIEKGVGAWVRGMLFLAFVVTIAVYVTLSILGVKYALVLALMAGIAEFLPYLGPIMSAIPAILIALTQSPLLALLTLVIYIVIQQLENHILVPKIMQKATGLHPIVSIFALLIGVKIAGIAGALLAIPVATVLRVIIEDLFRMVKAHR